MTENPTPGKSLYMLKFTVISIGIALVGGMILLFIVIYQRHSNSTKSAKTDPCAKEKLTVPVNSAILAMEQDGNRITLLTRGNRAGQELIVLDSCENKILNRISLVKSGAAD